MKKVLLIGLVAGLVLVSLISGASAYWTERIYYDDCLDFGDCESRDYGLYLRVGQDGGYGYYDYDEFAPDYPRLASGYSPGYYRNRYGYRYPNRYYERDDDWEYRRDLTYAVWDVSRDYDNWQNDIVGQRTGDVYGYGEGNKASDWSNKEAYVINPPFRDTNYYGEARWDAEGGYFNWRY